MATLFWILAGVLVILGFAAWLGVHLVSVGVGALFVAAAICALIAYFIGSHVRTRV